MGKIRNNTTEKKKCPICNKKQVVSNEKGEKKCNACGWINSSVKKACFVEYSL